MIRATREQLQASVEILDCLCELRAPAVGAAIFDDMHAAEQSQWVEAAVDHLESPQPTANAVCLLDT